MGYVMIDRVSLVSPSDHEQIRGHFGLTSSAGLVVDQLGRELDGARPIVDMRDTIGSEMDIIIWLISITQRGMLATNEDSNQ